LKLFDFGLAVCVKKNRTHDTTYRMTGNTGSLAYMAPEVALRKPYNEKVDVYSFAILLWQMLSGMELYLDVACANFVDQVVLGGLSFELDGRSMQASERHPALRDFVANSFRNNQLVVKTDADRVMRMVEIFMALFAQAE